MRQSIHLKNNKIGIELQAPEGSLRLLTFLVAYSPRDPNQAFAILRTPLGTSLLPGLAMSIDGGKELKFGFERCLNIGCQVAFPVDEAMLKEMRRGSKAEVKFFDMRGKGIALPVSLSGFTAALRSLKD